MVAVALGPWASHSEDRAEPYQGKGKFGKLGGEKSCIVVYGSARSSECEAHGPSATATI